MRGANLKSEKLALLRARGGAIRRSTSKARAAREAIVAQWLKQSRISAAAAALGAVRLAGGAAPHRLPRVGRPAQPRRAGVRARPHALARAISTSWRARCARQFRVVCPDVAGRGDSDRLADPKLYTWPQYVADMVTLIARLDVEAVNWLGTSMGGLVGMALAAQPGTPGAASWS